VIPGAPRRPGPVLAVLATIATWMVAVPGAFDAPGTAAPRAAVASPVGAPPPSQTGATPATGSPGAPAVLRPAAFDERGFARAIVRAQALSPTPMPGVRAIIVPHHWPAGQLIVVALRGLAATSDWERVIVVGPDHFRAGRRPAFTTVLDWATGEGAMATDRGTVARLIDSGVVADQPAELAREHGVAGLVPAVARFLPGAAVVAIAVRTDASRREVAALARSIAAEVDGRTVIVASADFAHDVTPRQARANNAESIAMLSALDLEALRAFGDEHVDARGALAVTLTVARDLGATRFVARAATDGSALPGYDGGPVTSYITGYFASWPGAPEAGIIRRHDAGRRSRRHVAPDSTTKEVGP
jgi:AmmeMemoRadiSam system protein B